MNKAEARRLKSTMEGVLYGVLEIQDAQNEEAACKAATECLELLTYDSFMISFLKEGKDGNREIVGDKRFATAEWAGIAPLTIRKYDVGPNEKLDLLPAVLKRKESKFICNMKTDAECDPQTSSVFGARSQYVIPLCTDSSAIGTIQIDMGTRSIEPESECRVLDALAAHLSVSIERHRTLELLEKTNNRLIDQGKFIAFEFGAKTTVHDLATGLDEVRRIAIENARLRDFCKDPKRVKDFLVFLAERLGTWIDTINLQMESVRRGNVVAVQATLQSAINDWIKKAHTRNCKIKTNLNCPDAKIYAQQGALKEVFGSLITNAIDAKARTIEIELQELEHKFPSNHKVIIYFRDDGNGIPLDYFDKVFSFGWTSKKEGEGNGMGLTIADSIITSMGGEFKLVYGGRSSAHPRTVFSIVLPCV